ncbi:Protein phosphatase PP2A regulatory subunit B [Balamuthia mandrillaris]
MASPASPVPSTTAAVPAATAVPASPYQSASLYVGDLHPSVTETLLFDIFKSAGPVASIRVCRDSITKRSLGYAYVNFLNVIDAERALDTLNYTPIKGKPCRIMWSHRDPSVRKSGQGNIFIKNLDKSIDNKSLYDTFSTFGNILSCKVVTDGKGNSKGYGFIHYETKEAADDAMANVNGMLLADKVVYVGPFIPRKERIPGSDPEKFTNLYIKHLAPDYSEEDLRRDFEPFGKIQSAVLMKNDKGESRGFAFVNFEDHEAALKAVEELSGKKKLGNAEKEVFVGRAQKKNERDTFLKQLREERAQKYQGINLYVKNLDDTVTDAKLEEQFGAFGNITSCKVMKDDKGNARGFGFVCYTSPDDASKAVTEMNGVMMCGKPIYVALAERKEVRRAKLEAQHAARAAARMAGGPNIAAAAGPGGVYPGAPLFYPQAPQAQRQGFVYTAAQGMPLRRWPQGAAGAAGQGVRQGGYPAQPMPNYMVPVAQRQAHAMAQGAAAGGRGGAPRAAGAQPQQGGIPPQGAIPQNPNNFKYTPNARNQQVGGQGLVGQPMLNGAPVHQQPGQEQGAQPLTAPTLASASPEERKDMLGESLYPLITSMEPVQGPKITGMLLDSMEVGELLHLLQSPQALREKIDEALEVLKEHALKVEEDGGAAEDNTEN